MKDWVAVHARANVKESVFPYIPPKVDLKDLRSNQKLVTDNVIEAAKKWFSENKGEFRYKQLQKSERDPKEGERAIVQLEGRLFAIYKGGKHFLKPLGKGNFGTVKLAQDLNDGSWHAFKMQKIELLGRKESVESEAKNLKKIGASIGSFSRYKSTHEQIAIQMELIKGVQLNYYMWGDRKLPETRWLKLCEDMIKSVQYLHKNELAHGDIKPQNFMIDPVSGVVKPVDLGFAVTLGTPDYKRGSRAFMAPELRSGDILVTYDEKTEVYALGVSAAAILQFLYTKPSIQIKDSEAARERIPDTGVRKGIIEYLNKMIAENPEDRPTVQEAIGFFKNAQEKYLKKRGDFRAVGLLDLDEYINADPATKEKLMTALQSVDEVWVIDAKEAHQDKYLEMRSELQLRVPITDRLFQGGRDITEALQKIPELITEPHKVFTYHYVTANPNAKNDERLLHEKNINLVSLEQPVQIEEKAIEAQIETQADNSLISQEQVDGIREELQAHADAMDFGDPKEAIDLAIQRLSANTYDTVGEVQDELKRLETKLLSFVEETPAAEQSVKMVQEVHNKLGK